MREIKFRAWDKDEKAILHWDFIEDDMLPTVLSHDSFIPMQYTGLKCNGHEWYEGDILENDSNWYQISWSNDDGRWEAVGIRSTGEILALSELLSQETWVQGNIYENPELLNPHTT